MVTETLTMYWETVVLLEGVPDRHGSWAAPRVGAPGHPVQFWRV